MLNTIFHACLIRLELGYFNHTLAPNLFLTSPLDIVTISVGIATQLPDAGNTPEQLISMADVALYEAKNSGRNKVCGMAISD